MIQLPNLYASFKSTFNGDFAAKYAISGGLIAGWEKQAIRPYAIIDVQPMDTEFDTGANYYQHYKVSIMAWNNESIAAAHGLGAALMRLFPIRYKCPALTDGAWTVHVIPLPMSVVVDDERDMDAIEAIAIEVFVVTCQWDVLLMEWFTT
jgi:hypothetical protein